MTDPLRPGLQPVSHLKAGPTTSSSRSTALPSPIQPPITRPSSRLRTQRASHREEVLDAGSDKATLALIRRVLCPQTSSNHGASSPQPPEELLPPLTSSNDVDRQLYAILAIIMKEFVYSWYSKITPDQTFVNEVLHVIAHCTRALEQRIRKIDAAQLILDEIPALVEAHILSHRLAKQQSHLSGLPTSHKALYHEMNPHPGLSPVPDYADPDTITAQSENEAVYRQLLVHGTLAILLPTEDLGNDTVRVLVGDVLADLILGKAVGDRICEARFLYEVVTKLTEIMRHRKSPENPGTSAAPANRLEKFGLLSTNEESARPQTASQSLAAVWVWNVLQSLYLGYVALRFIATGLFRVASNPGPGSSHGAGVSFPAATPESSKDGFESPLSDKTTNKRPILDYRVASMASQLLGMSQRMPWLSGFLALIQHLILAGPGRIGDTDGVFDRFLRETIEEYVLPPTLLPNLLLATRTTLFPANTRPVPIAAVAASNTAAPASTPQVSVPTLTPSGKGLITVPAFQTPIAEGGKVMPATIAGSEIVGKSSAGISSSNHVTSGNNNVSGGVNDQLPAVSEPVPETAVLSGATISQLTTDAIKNSTDSPTGSEKKLSLADTEIAAIKRRCAASLLGLIPRNVAQTYFGGPPPSRRDRTCSTTTGSLSSLTTTTTSSPCSPSPPASTGESGGDQSTRSSSQGKKRSPPSPSPISISVPRDPSASTLSGPRCGDSIAAGESRTDTDDEAGVTSDELFLLESIETDLLDPFSDEYCNKHLVYSIIETVLARILPELAERSVADLMEDRGIVPLPAAGI
ncbi:hypothetical protein N7466_001948 [Penicillium verhagenii]|uniref:uncharacterized protein n=1 Tax=Penicillium verhagenii TaxID=1562060 RepID=UPI002545589D|nr:uncharacterized protein N7466_001948 [Penicillium verhagenii]KAJ5938814.1 hypothetical protein N7466_001948 [Penicillium verhagenii]